MPSEPTIDQPMPGFDVMDEGQPCGLELTAPGGQLMAVLIIQKVSVEDTVLRVIPAFRAQSGYQGPIGFKLRKISAAEQELLRAAQEQ